MFRILLFGASIKHIFEEMMEVLSLDEIQNWKSFEDLVAEYFRTVKQDNEFNVDNVEVKQTGTGSDGGRDILVEFKVDDSIQAFRRVWVIQCKFHERDINKNHLSDINIPSLLHEYGADGYLLICKKRVTSPVSIMFEGFNTHCPFGRSYVIWNENNLLSRIQLKDNLIKRFFPQHHRFIKRMEKKLNADIDLK